MTTPITEAAARVAIYTMFVGLSGLGVGQVKLAWGQQPRSSTSHLEIRWISEGAVGYPSRTTGDAMIQAVEPSFLLTAYGEEQCAALRRIRGQLWIDCPERLAGLEAGIAVRSVGAVIDRTTINRTAYEPRADLSVTLGYVRLDEAIAPAAATGLIVDAVEISTPIDAPAIYTYPEG